MMIDDGAFRIAPTINNFAGDRQLAKILRI